MAGVYIPLWKKWWSYISEVELETASSEYNESLMVSLSQGRLQLSTKEAIYSYADKYDNFRECFQKMTLPKHAELLLLGFGLGSIPFMLEKKFGKKYNYTGVEIDETVIYLASKYVLSNLNSDIQLIHADAYSFVHVDQNQYDIIAMDIFISEKIPLEFESMEFLQDLSNKLLPNGIMLFNRLAKTKEELEKTQQYFQEIFLKIFPNADFVEVKGNHVLTNRKIE